MAAQGRSPSRALYIIMWVLIVGADLRAAPFTAILWVRLGDPHLLRLPYPHRRTPTDFSTTDYARFVEDPLANGK